MPQSFSQVLLHIVFSTKNRQPFITPEIKSELHSYIGGCLKSYDSFPYIVGGVEDHIHIACSLPRTITISELVEKLKRSSSHKAKEIAPAGKEFGWQTGYGAFSLGQSQLKHVVNYINSQEEHHKKQSFQDEFIEFLEKYNVQYDSKYIWE